MSLPQMGLLHPRGFDYIHTSDPTVSENPHTLHQTWLNSVSGEVFVCLDNTLDANVWKGSSYNSIELQQTTGDDIVINFPTGTKIVDLICHLKGTSTTTTSIYHGVNQDYSSSYDRRYYVWGRSDRGLQVASVPSSGKINSYGITELKINITVSPLGLCVGTSYSRLDSATAISGENVVFTKDSVTELSSYCLHLADTNNQFLAGSQIFYKVLYEEGA